MINFRCLLVALLFLYLLPACSDFPDTQEVESIGRIIRSSNDLQTLGLNLEESELGYEYLQLFNAISYDEKLDALILDDAEISVTGFRRHIQREMNRSDGDTANHSLEPRAKTSANRWVSISGLAYDGRPSFKYFVNFDSMTAMTALMRNRIRAEISSGISRWSNIPASGIRLSEITSSAGADVQIIFSPRLNSSEFARANFPENSTIGSVIRMYNPAFIGYGKEFDRSDPFSYYNVATHEIGHTLGLYHLDENSINSTHFCGTSTNPSTSIMYSGSARKSKKSWNDTEDGITLVRMYPIDFNPPIVSVTFEDQEGDFQYYNVQVTAVSSLNGSKYGKINCRVTDYQGLDVGSGYTVGCAFKNYSLPPGTYTFSVQGLVYNEANGTNFTHKTVLIL